MNNTTSFPNSASIYLNSSGTELVEFPMSKKGRVYKWYIGPLKSMNNGQAFICMDVCLALYEKFLRASLNLSQEYQFSENADVFKTVGKHFKISTDQAYKFWQNWRNGLQHHSMPKNDDATKYEMDPNSSKAFSTRDSLIVINPWLFRDKIIELLEKNLSIWGEKDYPLAIEFKKAC